MGHVLVLALDTSSPTGSIAVLRDAECRGVISTRSDEPYSSRLFRQLNFLLDELSVKLDEVDLFAVCTGPGSFTGLRVGLAAVKGWAEVYQKPIAAISALEAVATQSQSGAAIVFPVLDARRSQIYAGKYSRNVEKAPDSWTSLWDERVMTPEEFFLELVERNGGLAAGTVPYVESAVIVTPDPALLGVAFEKFQASNDHLNSVRIENISAVLAPLVGRLGLLRSQHGRLTNALSLDASYVRRSDAEMKWKDPAAL